MFRLVYGEDDWKRVDVESLSEWKLVGLGMQAWDSAHDRNEDSAPPT